MILAAMFLVAVWPSRPARASDVAAPPSPLWSDAQSFDAERTAFGVGPTGEAYGRAMQCLTDAIYYEAGGEPLSGQRAVAQVVLNRVRHPGFPKSICGVVFDGAWRPTGCQFTFTCDGSLSRRPVAWKWARAQSVAADALSGRVENEVGASTHYHASWMTPYWRSSMVETARIGGHVFYQMAGPQGQPTALTGMYTGMEPDPATLTQTRSPSSLSIKTRFAHAVARRPTPAQPAILSIWGLAVATVTPKGEWLTVRTDQ
jgi:hypothetical protein